jgi:uncharacterized protein (DUF362 family)
LLVVVEGTDLGSMLRAGIEALPAFDEAVRDRERVVIKPNATAAQLYPVTTDVQLIRTLIELIRQRSEAEITVCDSPSYAGLAAHRVFSTLGYFDLQGRRVSVRCIDPTIGTHFVEVSSLSWTRHAKLLTTKLVQEADLVINLAIPKRHHAADLSCALKNNMGCIYDTFRTLAHLELAKDSPAGTEAFDLSLAEFADAVHPELTIVDARSILARRGPAFVPGESEIVEGVNRLMLSGDMVAADSYAADLMEKYDDTFSRENRVNRQLDYAQALGIGVAVPEELELIELSA